MSGCREIVNKTLADHRPDGSTNKSHCWKDLYAISSTERMLIPSSGWIQVVDDDDDDDGCYWEICLENHLLVPLNTRTLILYFGITHLLFTDEINPV